MWATLKDNTIITMWPKDAEMIFSFFLIPFFLMKYSDFSENAFCKGVSPPQFLFFSWAEFGASLHCNQAPFGGRSQHLWCSCIAPWQRLLPSSPRDTPAPHLHSSCSALL